MTTQVPGTWAAVLDDMTEQVPVIKFPADWWLTAEGEKALDAAEQRSREIAEEARQLAMQRRTSQIDGTLPTSV
jgi:hypothetical protein